MLKKKSIFISLLILGNALLAQPIPLPVITVGKSQPTINQHLNTISGIQMEKFYRQLQLLQQGKKQTINIVHIGDSHIQADALTSVVRNGLQAFFGNAGRGIVFPHQLAQSNAAADIQSSTESEWQFNRLAHPEIPIAAGISGFCIQTELPFANIQLNLRAQNGESQQFDAIQLFTDSSTVWQIQSQPADSRYSWPAQRDSNGVVKIDFNAPTDRVTIQAVSGGAIRSFFGFNLMKKQAGIRYHVIGVNGATYEHYLNAPKFWQQLPALNADLYIISLGTNEAQKADFNPELFLARVTQMVNQLKAINPNAVILITTPQDSYLGRGSNPIMKQVCFQLTNFCMQQQIPVWDLYRISNGFGSAYRWAKLGFMSRDRVHFTAAGYQIQGKLLLRAIAQGFNQFNRAD
ncbi:MAG: hypothetical protein RLY16_1235 [Bacteroidota bacterium]